VNRVFRLITADSSARSAAGQADCGTGAPVPNLGTEPDRTHFSSKWEFDRENAAPVDDSNNVPSSLPFDQSRRRAGHLQGRRWWRCCAGV